MSRAATSGLILGIDPGYDRLGWAVGELTKPKPTMVACGCIETDAQADYYARLTHITQAVEKLLNTYQISAGVFETLLFGRNTTTAIKVAQARGVVIGQLLARNIPIYEYGPSQIKLAVTGYGRADKAAVAKLSRLQVQGKLPAVMRDDTMDAIALLITHSGCIV